MPFKSERQKGYLLAHPEITDKQGKPVGKKWAKKYGTGVSKGKHDWTKAIVAGTAAGALANQFPRIQDISTEKKRRKRAKIQKVLAPTSTDPYYNQAAAQKAFDLVMKMDDDTAEMFTYVVASDLFETEVEQNLGTIQKALNQVFAERTERVKKALVKAALNAPADQIEEYQKAYSQVEEISKAPHTPQYYGYQWDPSDFKRDPHTGRFMVKVKHTMTAPLKEKSAKAVIGSYGPARMTRNQRTRYQDEYRQVASFLSAVQEGGLGVGNSDIIYHLRDTAGNTFAASNNSGEVPSDILENPETTLLAMEAKPTTLSVGGAAYGLSEAMGRGPLTGDQMARYNLAATELPGATASWASAGDPNVQSARMFTRLQTSGKYVNQVAPPGSKAQLAGKFAEIVGQYGPEAEKVLGPSARKTAYRYRGTEKTPDEDLVRLYGQEIQQAKRHGVIEDEARQLGFGTRREGRRGDFIASDVRRPMGGRERRVEAVTPAISQMARTREGEAQMMVREPTWAEQGQGTAAIAEFLRSQALPDKHLYRLHVAAGNTPPSEGIMIDSKGQIASQSVGYGDDHYVPFNLKNLKELKGGEYIRTRSVGGPTSEDIYTGLMAGARRLTVVSRSGTFTVEFDPKLRGGRRHNDKARRMTRRYEQILDAVQSGTVDRQTIPKHWRDAIRREVEEDYPAVPNNAEKAAIRDEVKARITEFKENPDIEGRDLDRAEEMILDMEMRASRGEASERDVADFRRQIHNQLFNMKEVRFRLNGVGYEAGLNTLQEQFPYYIKVDSKPTKDEELLEFEMDEGYVEPGRGRPTKVNAGYFGTKENPEEQTGFISGSRVNYQRGRTGGGVTAAAAAVPNPVPNTPGAPGAASPGGTNAAQQEAQRVRDVFAAAGAQTTAKRAKWELLESAKLGTPTFAPHAPPVFWGKETEAEFLAWLEEDPENEKNFDLLMKANAKTWSAEGQEGSLPGFGEAWTKYNRATGLAKQTPFTKDMAGQFPPYPYTFSHLTEEAYHAGARLGAVTTEMTRLDKEPMLTTRKPLSALTDSEMSAEIDRTKLLATNTLGKPPAVVDQMLGEHKRTMPDTHPTSRMKGVLASQATIDTHLESIHRQRYLQEMKKTAKNLPSDPGRGGAAPGPTGGLPRPSGGGPGFQSPRGKLKATAIDLKAREDWKAASATASKILVEKTRDRTIGGPGRNQAVHDLKHVNAFFKWLNQRPDLSANEIDEHLRTIPPNAMQYITQSMPKGNRDTGGTDKDIDVRDWDVRELTE